MIDLSICLSKIFISCNFFTAFFKISFSKCTTQHEYDVLYGSFFLLICLWHVGAPTLNLLFEIDFTIFIKCIFGAFSNQFYHLILVLVYVIHLFYYFDSLIILYSLYIDPIKFAIGFHTIFVMLNICKSNFQFTWFHFSKEELDVKSINYLLWWYHTGVPLGWFQTKKVQIVSILVKMYF